MKKNEKWNCMTDEELDILLMPQTRQAIMENIDRDPLKIALDKSIAHAAAVATQVKYLRRAEKKLPSFRRAFAILPQRAFEQSSSEAAAMHKQWSGDECLDLTCGLGVDSFALAHRFRHVTAIECDRVLARAVCENFARLGVENIDTLCCRAEEYLADCQAVDLIYVDPDRRDADGKKLVRLEECSPDITALLPLLRNKCKRLVVKNSPLFDIDEAFRIFGRHTIVEAVSAGGECKEVLVEVSDSIAEPVVRATALGEGSFERPAERAAAACSAVFTADYGYLLSADVALRKARLSADHFAASGADWFDSDGYGFAHTPPQGFIGRCYPIVRMLPYKPKELKRMKIGRATIMKQSFPLSTARICADTGIREGGENIWAFTRIDGSLWAIELKNNELT